MCNLVRPLPCDRNCEKLRRKMLRDDNCFAPMDRPPTYRRSWRISVGIDRPCRQCTVGRKIHWGIPFRGFLEDSIVRECLLHYQVRRIRGDCQVILPTLENKRIETCCVFHSKVRHRHFDTHTHRDHFGSDATSVYCLFCVSASHLFVPTLD